MDPPPHDFPGDIRVVDTTEFKLLQAVGQGDLRRFKWLAKMLDMGRGRLKNAVEDARMRGVPGMEGYGALHVAARNNVMVMCKYLVEKLQVDVNTVNEQGHTPLFLAAVDEHLEIVKYLLDHGADHDQADHSGLTPLHAAAGKGHCEMVKFLLDRGAFVDPISDFGTPLHIAATEGQDGTMKILLDHDADCDIKVNGATPVLVAMKADSVKCLKLLVEAGAEVDEDLIIVFTTFVDAANNGSTECLNFLREHVGINHHVLNNDRPVSERKIAELKSLGLKAIERNDYHSAAGFYSKAMDLDPNDATLLANRSLCWLRLGDGGNALLDACRCRNKRPDWPKAYYRQGAALMLLEDYVRACEALFDGFKLDPGNAELENALREAMDCLMTSRST